MLNKTTTVSYLLIGLYVLLIWHMYKSNGCSCKSNSVSNAIGRKR